MIEIIPRTVLFGNPSRANPQISPRGNQLAYIAPVNGVLNVWTGNLFSDQFQPVTKDTDRGIRAYFWAEDNRHLFYVQDVGGNENWRLYAVDLGTGQIRDLTPYENVQVQVIEHNKHHPDELLVAMNLENEQVHDVYHLDIRTGRVLLRAKNPGNYAGWVTDSDLRVRGAIEATPDGGFRLLLRDKESDEWRVVAIWEQEDALTSGPVCFSRNGSTLYLKDSRNANAARILSMDVATGETRTIAVDPDYDAGDLIIHPDRYEIQAVSFTKARDEWVILDPSIEQDLSTVRALHPGDFFLESRDHQDRNWIAGFTADDGPVPYYHFDRDSKRATFLFDHRPELKKYNLASMEPISFVSSDGLTIHGYITFPREQSRKGLPVVLNVHGGPWHRDNWGFNPEAQWFANRGYICLQVNFRGSTGYGKKFLNAGDREWGGKMHQDLVDAVHWIIDIGCADPKRIAIYGGSYGGYAALVGATFTPDLFRCAVAIVGPSNLLTFIRSIPAYWSTYLSTLHKRVGNPDTESEFLMSRSPLFKVDQIKIPMLIAQGANDPRVKQAESEQIVSAMKEKGIPHEYLLFPDEGHGFAKPENRLRFYQVAEKFLATHLGGRFEN
jgi:dipeptidyl aminopeptidase/acylaminoacyl peptidase